jgi:hypothetical protein
MEKADTPHQKCQGDMAGFPIEPLGNDGAKRINRVRFEWHLLKDISLIYQWVIGVQKINAQLLISSNRDVI